MLFLNMMVALHSSRVFIGLTAGEQWINYRGLFEGNEINEGLDFEEPIIIGCLDKPGDRFYFSYPEEAVG